MKSYLGLTRTESNLKIKKIAVQLYEGIIYFEQITNDQGESENAHIKMLRVHANIITPMFQQYQKEKNTCLKIFQEFNNRKLR